MRSRAFYYGAGVVVITGVVVFDVPAISDAVVTIDIFIIIVIAEVAVISSSSSSLLLLLCYKRNDDNQYYYVSFDLDVLL